MYVPRRPLQPWFVHVGLAAFLAGCLMTVSCGEEPETTCLALCYDELAISLTAPADFSQLKDMSATLLIDGKGVGCDQTIEGIDVLCSDTTLLVWGSVETISGHVVAQDDSGTIEFDGDIPFEVVGNTDVCGMTCSRSQASVQLERITNTR